ncbi:hypothetical protein PHYBLDRAFT_161740 [Phycomyces blakesleeanus NRRL 1555(-)]|uniref:Reverse transcriptase zinc-binding domain-containing protein n=1 Tax=Phycomyces blakesleeanus (strain ATCC 8743b / DSM 1359 / FGSC 10004 / NBRC 33097 / NRRL 1555) TaxID=763407 RepID=A0A167R8L2_PHYB8|nr:hypothetical protein PHYBLDRAFT_161740 [Phycomyces blakesleeanus NRRL 1555(-)]OAD81107.1 hypothetical protein PHYBLDRAFT_161740 [Phycomyces blakesleeanus NRRL 1555(-)]|eukprot:XP_018299147.1 hypothetical protein PHYBLDRAFT_161740 [Phycomyces blakesleeanus NRRL 1555(-)]
MPSLLCFKTLLTNNFGHLHLYGCHTVVLYASPPILFSQTLYLVLAAGDFKHAIHSNYALGRRGPLAWLQFLDNHMVDCVTPPGQNPQPTFYRALSSTTIDYILASPDLHPRTTDSQALLSKIENSCILHSSCTLSFRGRATVMNSLILAQLWHVLHVVSFPVSFLKKIRTLMRRFFCFCSFPPIALDTLCLPCFQGGLGILDPITQQCALQLRWLKPIIQNPLGPCGLVPKWMASLLRTENTDCDPLLLWIFPDSRPRTHCSLDSPLHLVLKAIDHLPHKFDDVLTNLSTCLMLPLSSMVNHLYQIDHNLDVLMPIAPARPLPRFITLNCILQRLLNHSLVAHPILFRACIPTFILESRHLDMPPQDGSPFDFDPFISALVLGKPWSHLSTRSYRLTCSHHHANAQPLSPHLSPRQLHSFWSFALPYRARNVWFRGLHNKLSCQALLHHIMPFTVSSPLCNICQMSIETQEHFLLSCPLKSVVWLGIWLEFFGTVPPPSALSSAFTSFLFPLTLNSSIPATSVFGLTILAI